MAADEFANRPRTSFAAIEFPVERYRLRGSIRHHVHIYAHVPGGDIEKLGRNLYEAEISALFLTSSTKYPNLWPDRLAALRELFEQEWTDWLVLPSIGKIKAVCTEWDQEFVAKILNGERATFRFMEDQSAAFLLDKLVNSATKTIDSSSAQLVTLAQAMNDALGPARARPDLFDVIQNTANQILGIRDQADLAGQLLGAKIGMLTALCNEADRTVEGLQHPEYYPTLEALKDLWDAARGLGEAIIGTPTTFRYFTTPTQMTAAQVAFEIYRDTSRTEDILNLNDISDAYAIPARTKIRYIPDESAQAA